MAYYTINDDKIHNCKKGGLFWWHEKGHQWLYHNVLFMEIKVNVNYFIFLAVGALCFQEYKVAKIAFAVTLSMMLFEEVFAWIYAICNRNRDDVFGDNTNPVVGSDITPKLHKNDKRRK